MTSLPPVLHPGGWAAGTRTAWPRVNYGCPVRDASVNWGIGNPSLTSYSMELNTGEHPYPYGIRNLQPLPSRVMLYTAFACNTDLANLPRN